jgi:hypothetical protein
MLRCQPGAAALPTADELTTLAEGRGVTRR